MVYNRKEAMIRNGVKLVPIGPKSKVYAFVPILAIFGYNRLYLTHNKFNVYQITDWHILFFNIRIVQRYSIEIE